MELKFSKYHGTGNDFIIIDRIAGDDQGIEWNANLISQMCNRRFGIGADGMIIIDKVDDYDFEMIYYNSDGAESSMCGNGGRCIAQFAFSKKYVQDTCRFLAIDGSHLAKAKDNFIHLQMQDVHEISQIDDALEIQTGSPHYVYYIDSQIEETKFVETAKNIRFNTRYKEKGININALRVISPKSIEVLTYERGVEAITYSCGTGVVAAAIANAENTNIDVVEQEIITKGGTLFVKAEREGNIYKDVWLIGPAKKVYEGVINL